MLSAGKLLNLVQALSMVLIFFNNSKVLEVWKNEQCCKSSFSKIFLSIKCIRSMQLETVFHTIRVICKR